MDVNTNYGFKRFKFLDCTKDGKLLLIHHTIDEDSILKRIRFTRADFSHGGNVFAAIDHRGNIFIFHLANEIYQVLSERVPKCSCLKFHENNESQLIIGTKDGTLILLEFGGEAVVEAAVKIKSQPYSWGDAIINITFPVVHQPEFKSTFFLTATKTRALIHDLVSFEELPQNRTESACVPIKEINFLPLFENIVVGICSDDSFRIWGTENFELFRKFDVLGMRTEFLQRNKVKKLTVNMEPISSSENVIRSLKKDFSKGQLTAFCCSNDSKRLLVATLDSHLIAFRTNDGNFEVNKVVKFTNNVHLTKIQFILSELENSLIVCLTDLSDLVIIDLDNMESQSISQFVVTVGNCRNFAIVRNYKVMALLMKTGEIELISMQFVLERMELELNRRNLIRGSQRKGAVASSEIVQNEIKLTLPPNRLIGILQEYDEYPEKYRQIIWRTLLKLPQNVDSFCELLRKGYHPCVKDYEQLFPLKNRTALRVLKKIVSCLAHWCPIFGQCDFVPHFVFPFLKLNDKNLPFTFEVCATLFYNQGQLLFEFAPLEPFNYLGMIENLLSYYDAELMDFYLRQKVKSSTFAWQIIRTAFSEVLDANQWLQLWDQVVTNEPKFLIFCVLGYNIYQKSVIMQLEDKKAIETFLQDQNLIDVKRFFKLVYKLFERCPPNLDPGKYFKQFQPLSRHLYPKFYNYPRPLVDRVEDERMVKQREVQTLEERMEAVNQLESNLQDKLDKCLKTEEHQKRIKEVERALDEALIHEEERVANHKHLMMLYEREQRHRELGILFETKECEVRNQVLSRERELEGFLRNLERNRIRDQAELTVAEERLCKADVERRTVGRRPIDQEMVINSDDS